MADFPKPVLMRRDEIMSIEQAAHYAGRSTKIVRKWARAHGIGRQAYPNAPLEISRPALDMVLHGDFDALEKLRTGKRDCSEVARYFEFAGLPT